MGAGWSMEKHFSLLPPYLWTQVLEIFHRHLLTCSISLSHTSVQDTTKTTLQFSIDPSNGCRDITEAASAMCCRLEVCTRALRREPEFPTAPLIAFSRNPQKNPSPVSFPFLFALPASRPNFILPVLTPTLSTDTPQGCLHWWVPVPP